MNRLRMKASSIIEVGDLVLGVTAESNFQATFGLVVANRELGGFYYIKILWLYDAEMRDVDYEMSWAKESEVSLFKKKAEA